MKYRYDTPPKKAGFEIIKVIVSSLVLALCMYLFTISEKSIGLGIFALVVFCFLIHGINELFGRKKDMPFTEIDEENIYWRNEAGGPTYRVKIKEIDSMIAGHGMFYLGINDESVLFSLNSYDDYQEVKRLLKEVAPQALFKQFETDE